jgi:hypothetical protein
MLHDLLGLDLRSSPAHDLVLYDRLPEAARSALAELAQDPGFYGVLRNRDTAALKSVDRDTALLFYTLREPGPLPAYVRAQLGDTAPRLVSRLVADGILEVEMDGSFVSGPAALAGLGEEAGGGRGGEGRIAAISVAALRYGQSLPLDDPSLLAWRLYSYNRQPLTPAWQRRLPTAAAVERWLGIDRGGASRKLLDRSWSPLAVESWLSWQSRSQSWSQNSGAGGHAGGPTWKLYVSPRPEALAESFGEVLAALTAARAAQFKVGRDAGGLLRPDKIVAYFPSWERLAAAAGAVLERLDGVPAQGVPFTAEVGGAGMVSWGVDPPEAERSILGGGRESWRVWVAQRLAWSLLAARRAGEGAEKTMEPWRFALDRVRLEGVDTDTWAPSAALWKS